MAVLSVQDGSPGTGLNEQQEPPRPFRFSFRDCYVEIAAEDGAVLDALHQRFHRLRTREVDGKRLVGRLQILGERGGYHLRGGRRGSAAGGPLERIVAGAKYEAVMHLADALPELLWLHAGAVAQEYGVLLCGTWGRGKSTLATALVGRGWTYLSDDVAPIDLATGHVLPFPITPLVRRPDTSALTREQLRHEEKTPVALSPEDVCDVSVPVAAVVFPSYEPDAEARLTECSGSEAAVTLLQNCINLKTGPQVFSGYLCGMARTVPAVLLRYSTTDQALDLLAGYLSTLPSTVS